MHFLVLLSSIKAQAFLLVEEAGASVCWGAQASHYGGFSRCTGSGHAGLSSCSPPGLHLASGVQGAWASAVVAHGLSCSVGRVESSQTRDGTCVPYIEGWVLTHCTTREVPYSLFVNQTIEMKAFVLCFCLAEIFAVRINSICSIW